MSFDSLLDIVKKHGATGVLCLWVMVMHTRLNNVERLLYECYQNYPNHTKEQNEKIVRTYAVLPEPIKAKRRKDV